MLRVQPIGHRGACRAVLRHERPDTGTSRFRLRRIRVRGRGRVRLTVTTTVTVTIIFRVRVRVTVRVRVRPDRGTWRIGGWAVGVSTGVLVINCTVVDEG